MSPEAMALLCTAGPVNETGPLREAVARVTSWKSLFELAWRSGAQPVFERRILAEAADLLPDEVADSLRQSRRIHEIRLTHLHHRLRQATDVLAAEGIDVLLLKGAATAYTTHASPAERPMSDIDLLVRSRDAQLAWHALLGSGWSRKYPVEHEGLYQEMHHLPPLVDGSAGLEIKLEIHTDILPPERNPFGFTAREMWADAQQLPELSAGCLVPSDVHTLLHCAIHFAWSHMMREGGWKTFRDVSAMAARRELDWGAVVSFARRTRSDSCCYWTLSLARDLSLAPIPLELLHDLRIGRPGRVLRTVVANEMVPGERACPSLWVSQRLWEMAIRPGRSGHGDIRPWSGTAIWNLPGADAAAAPDPQRGLAGWLRFARSLAGR